MFSPDGTQAVEQVWAAAGSLRGSPGAIGVAHTGSPFYAPFVFNWVLEQADRVGYALFWCKFWSKRAPSRDSD